MSEINLFDMIDLNNAEIDVYKLLLRLSKDKDTQIYNKIKVADLVELSKYSKPIIYKVIKKLENTELILIDNTRPMFITPINPKIAIKNLITRKKNSLDSVESELINELNNLPEYPNYQSGKTPPISFFDGVEKYFKRMRNLLEQATSKIILICGFLIKGEETMLRDYIAEKLNEGLEISIFYGGSAYDFQEREGVRFKDFFEETIINPNKALIAKAGTKCTIDGAVLGPPLRVTLADDSDLIMVLKDKELEKNEPRSGITRISSFQSKNRDLVRFTDQTYKLLTTFFMEILKDHKIIKQILNK